MRTLPQSFVGGELSPRMMGRPDDPKYQHGAALLRNFFVHPTGAASLRPGTERVNDTRNHDKRSRAIRYRASGGQDIQVELGFRQEYPGSSSVPGYLRLHRRGLPVLHSQPWSAATAYVVGNLVTQAGSLYHCRLAHTNQTPPNATYWETLEYVPNRPFVEASVNVGTNEIDFGAPHNLETAEPIEWTSDSGTLPSPLAANVVNYAIVISANVIKVATSVANALLGTAIDLLDDGSAGAAHRMHRRYTAGELVSQSGSVFYCRTSRPITGSPALSIPANAGNETHWYLEPATGEYEVPTTLAITEDALFALTYSQEGTVLSTAARGAFPCELRAVPANAVVAPTTPLIPYEHWRWTQVVFTPALSPPTGLASTPKYGHYIQVATNTGNNSLTSLAPHTLASGETVYASKFLTSATTIGGNLLAGYYTVENQTATTFTLKTLEGNAPIATPLSVDSGFVRVTRANSDDTNSYVVTAVGEDDRESVASSVHTVTNNLLVSGSSNALTWGAVTGAQRYRVYRLQTGTALYGLIGQSSTAAFKDDGTVAPNIGQTPPTIDASLSSAPSHTALPTGGEVLPEAVTHFEGRRAYALGQDVWLTRSNTESDLSYSLPVKATDRIRQRVKTKIACEIRHLVPMGRLLALADTTEIRIGPANTEALTPDSFAARSDSYVGAAVAQPETMTNAVLFAGNRGGHLYQLGFSEEAGGFVVQSLCDRAAHLFTRRKLVQIAAMVEPVPIAFGVSDDGRLLGLTFVPGQQVFAWHQHTTDGAFESVSTGSEDGEDRVYVIVRRTIQGLTRRYVERFASFGKVAWNDSWHVDSGVRMAAPGGVVTGLGHLEGKTVAVFADGLDQAERVVTGGQVTLDGPATLALVGLPPLGELQTVRAAFAVEAYGSGKPKNTSKVWVLVDESGVFEAGPSLAAMIQPDDMAAGAPTSDMVEVRVDNAWAFAGQLFIRQTKPLPLNIVSITAEMEVAG